MGITCCDPKFCYKPIPIPTMWLLTANCMGGFLWFYSYFLLCDMVSAANTGICEEATFDTKRWRRHKEAALASCDILTWHVGLPHHLQCYMRWSCFPWLQLRSSVLFPLLPCCSRRPFLYAFFCQASYECVNMYIYLLVVNVMRWSTPQLGMWILTVFAIWCWMTVVVAVEHLDGSSSMAHYHDHEGKCKWVHHAFGDKPVGDTPMAERAKQLRQVTKHCF